MELTSSLRHQKLDRLTDKFNAVVAKQRLSLPIDQADRAVLVADHDGVGSRVEQLFR
jgi:hypothetical protein